ncbi:histidinol dehydrogenase [Aliikangiella sp. IMCC44653]
MITKAQDWQRPKLGQQPEIATAVSEMLRAIELQGESEVDRLALKFDQLAPTKISLLEFNQYDLDPKLKQAILLAAERIEKFARFQKASLQSTEFSDEFGRYGQNVSSLENIGAYIPAGRFPLISTALMTLIPAKVAGCQKRIACSPSNDPAILAAASLAGATEFWQIGGVQAIGALTFGYKSIAPVDLIVGPGNAWVAEAKKQVQYKLKIDGLAGPSELLALCDANQPIDWITLDALAQAEHDPMACSIIVSDSKSWLVKLLAYIEAAPESKALLDNQQIALVYAESPRELIQFSEAYAPEHLMLCHEKITAAALTQYGSLFIGANSAVALGDYISGPNHTLPTLGYARQNGGLSVNSFLKVTTFQELNEVGRKQLSQAASHIAKAEGLSFHQQSLQVRF